MKFLWLWTRLALLWILLLSIVIDVLITGIFSSERKVIASGCYMRETAAFMAKEALEARG